MMKKVRIFIIASLLVALLAPAISFSQLIRTSDYNSWSLSVKGGLMYFYGDVRQLNYTSDNPYKKTNGCFGIEATKNFNHILSARLGALTGGLSGSSPNLNLHFTTQLKQYTLEGVVNLNDLISFYPRKAKICNAYLFAGVGMIAFHSKVYTYDENTFVTGFGWDTTGNTKTKARQEWVYPFGIGIRFKADATIDVGVEFSMQLTNTDKLDAWMVAGSYMDRYSHLTASITFKIGKKKEYVDWVNPFADTSKTTLTYAQTKAVVKDTAAVKTSKTENVVNTNKTENAEKVNNSISTAPVSKYYILAGVYTSKKLAKEEVEKQKKNGYAMGDIVNDEGTGAWLAVYKAYLSEEDARADLDNIKMMNTDVTLFKKEGGNDYTELLLNSAPEDDTTHAGVKTNNVTTPKNSNVKIESTVKKVNDTVKEVKAVNTIKNNVSNTSITPADTMKKTNASQTSPVTEVKKFFIIAGSFPNEQLANDAVADLKAKGYTDAEVVGKNDAGNWRICFKAFATRDAANAELPAIKQKNPTAWIFEKK